MSKKLYIVSIFSAGGGQRGSSHSNGIASLWFHDKIDFNQIRNVLKERAIKIIEEGCPCVNEMQFFTQTLVIVDNKAVGFKNLNVKFTNVLKWRSGKK